MTQTKVGWRAYVATTTTTASTLLTSIYGVWNADTTSTVTTLNTNVYSAYNGENTLNDVVNSRNLTVGAGSVTYGTGKVGTNCFTLTSGQLNFPTNSMRFSGSFSYAFWVKYTGTSPQYNGLFTTAGNQSRFGYSIYNYNGSLYTRFGDGTTVVNNDMRVVLNPSFSFVVNTWYHIAVVFNAGSSAQVYANGQLLSSVNHTMAAVTYDTSRPNPIFGNNPGTGTYGPMTGQLDAITFWDKGLTYAEVAALYNEGNGLQYSFPSSVTAYVPSPNDAVSTNHGTLMNGTTFTTGKIGQAFRFDGVNDYVALPNSSFDFAGDFSISAWVKITSNPSSGGAIFSNYNYDVVYNYGYLLLLNANKTVYFGTNNGVNNPVVITSTTALALNTWYNITIKRDSVTKSNYLYINGTLEAQVINTGVGITYGTRAIQPTIGAIRQNNQGTLSSNNFLNGQVDALNIWNKALTTTEVTELYNAGTGKQYPNY